jgi:hypothetical protein
MKPLVAQVLKLYQKYIISDMIASLFRPPFLRPPLGDGEDHESESGPVRAARTHSQGSPGASISSLS